MGGEPLNVPLFIGSMLPSRNRVASLVGTGILLFNGSAIACLGRLIWPFGTGGTALLQGLGFGGLLGLVSIGVMKILVVAHPKSTEMQPISQTLVSFTLWIGHLLYGGCVALVFAASWTDPQSGLGVRPFRPS